MTDQKENMHDKIVFNKQINKQNKPTKRIFCGEKNGIETKFMMTNEKKRTKTTNEYKKTSNRNEFYGCSRRFSAFQLFILIWKQRKTATSK